MPHGLSLAIPRTEVGRLPASMSCAATALVHSGDRRAYEEFLAKPRGAATAVEVRAGEAFERLSASVSREGVDISVQARTPVRPHFRERARRTLVLCLAGSSQVVAGRRVYDLGPASSGYSVC